MQFSSAIVVGVIIMRAQGGWTKSKSVHCVAEGTQQTQALRTLKARTMMPLKLRNRHEHVREGGAQE